MGFLHTHMHGYTLKDPLKFYGSDCLATLSEQQYCQTITNSFVAFPMFICSWVGSQKYVAIKTPSPLVAAVRTIVVRQVASLSYGHLFCCPKGVHL